MNAVELLAVVASSVTAAALTGLLVRPTPRLAARVRPYTVHARTSLGRAADVRAVAYPGGVLTGGTLRRLLGPPFTAFAQRVGRYLDTSSDEVLRRKLQQAGLLSDLPEPQRVTEYRVRQLGASLAGVGIGVAGGIALGQSLAVGVVLAGLGFTVGATHWRSRLDRAIEERRGRMRIELYTINQLLAMHVRVGGGVVQATRRVVERGNGAVVDELAAVVRAHRSGVPVSEAFARAARETAEPTAARTFRILAAGAEHGADLADALLAHSENVREARRDAIKRAATKRRAAMLVPIIGVLAPVMLLFIAAPLPSLVFGAR